uniref:Uncharacterized protein n=1 Tax=Nannospalax galili TaxID=1026970 RepID=A0A8C6WA23_NANGA
KQGTWRAGIYFPFKKVLCRELNKCRPFSLWLLPFLENILNSELFKDNCLLSLFACTTIQDGKPGLTYYTGLSEFACGHL